VGRLTECLENSGPIAAGEVELSGRSFGEVYCDDAGYLIPEGLDRNCASISVNIRDIFRW